MAVSGHNARRRGTFDTMRAIRAAVIDLAPASAVPQCFCTPRAWGKGEDRRTIGVGTSVVQRVLGVNSHDRSLRVGAGRSGTPAAQHGLMVFKIKLSEERRTMANARS